MLCEVKNLLSNYFANQLPSKMDSLIAENNMTAKNLEDWSNEYR